MPNIEIKRIGRAKAAIAVEGTAPLIVNRFSEKAKQMMLDAQTGRKAKVRENKDPDALFRASLYPIDGDRYGFPGVGFKAAIVGAARFFDKQVTMIDLKQSVFVAGEGPELLVAIDGTPKMREDTVRNATGVADLRYRGEFWPWAATIEVIYVKSMFGLDSILALVDAAGIGGIGEWRPASKKSYTGMYGTFKLVDDQDVKEVLL